MKTADEDAAVKDEIEIKVIRSKGLQGSKGPQFLVVAKVEFGSTGLGESSKVEVKPDNEYAVFDFTSTLSVVASEPLVLDELTQTPVVVTFSEILPKDKKSKEEKSNVLGQCCIDLLPLIRGDLSYSVIEYIHPVSATVAPNESSEQVLPEVEISISTASPLMTPEQLSSCNLLTVCIESAFSLPEAWNLNGGQYMYAACMPVPITAEKEAMVLVPSGLYRAAGEKEMSGQRKWSCVPNASGSCLYIPNTEIHHSAYEDEDGDLRNREDMEFRVEAENQKQHITWNSERRCFLSSSSTECLQQKIAHHRYWPLEIIRTIQPTNVKGKGKEEEPQSSYHGIAYVDLAPLLYPGVSKIRGAYLVHPYSEVDAEEKLQRKGVIDEEVVKTIIGVIRSSSSIGQSNKSTKPGKGETKVKQSIGMIKSDVDGDGHEVLESQQYTESRTYVILELQLEKPLVKKRELGSITARVAELIPPRSPFPKNEGGSKKVVDDFEQEIAHLANILLEEFRSMFGADFSPNDQEERKRVFLYELNTSGKYYAFKERLKYFIVKIVREKFMYTTNFDNQEELQAFISKLYIFLLDHMNLGLNKYLSTEEMTEIPPPITDSKMLKHFAKEAEVTFRYDLAAKYYQERIARYKGDVECWLDYGVFCLSIEDTQKAEECIREVVAINQSHMKGLLLNAQMCLLHEEYEIAEELLDAVTYMYPDFVLPWTLLGLYYSGVDNSIMAERAFKEANKLLYAEEEEEEKEEKKILAVVDEDSADTVTAVDGELTDKLSGMQITECIEKKEDGLTCETVFLQTAHFLLDMHVVQMAERALAHELTSQKEITNVLYYELLGQLHMQQKQYTSALHDFEQALVLRHENPKVWSLKGHVYYITGDFTAAKECYERCLAYTEDAPDMHAVYIRLANIYLEKEKNYMKAKTAYLKVCKLSPSCVTWLGTGISCYRLNELDSAEQALNEANILDNKNPDVWAYLALVCLKKRRHLEAEHCYKYSIKLGVYDEVLIDELKETMTEAGFDTCVL